ncbi:hypothetical protein RN001_012076 [Aquatica leii]|uniref:RNA-binding S4 domain-containing protein n=1 Tax=Aquatica leii TaxID=1421715 RepID=A0AAN7SEZ1_9COLE|nr:hypothetical protein RN001_012076 [Aquatica leii]
MQISCKPCNAPIKLFSTIPARTTPALTSIVFNPVIELHRFKSKKSKKKQEVESEDEEESEAEIEDFDSALVDKQTKVITVKVNTMRCDVVLKSALYMARNKVEELFYESKIRVNGKQIYKKSDLVKEGDEIDVIKGVDSKNPKFLNVARVEILNVAPKGEGFGLRSITVEIAMEKQTNTFGCLAIFGERKKVLRCDKSELIQVIRDQFEIHEKLEIQTFNSDYDEWTEADINTLENKVKIKIVIVPTTSLEFSDSLLLSNIVSENVERRDAYSVELGVLPRPYRLPKFAPDLETLIKSVTTVSASMRRRIVQTLFDDMFQYTKYPNSREYNDVCALLIYKYPNLSDKTPFIHIHSRPYESWHRGLVTKFKSERQKIKTDVIVNDMRQKHASVRKAVDTENSSLEKKQRLATAVPSDDENEDTLRSHLEDIRYQCESELVKDCERLFKKNITTQLNVFFTDERKKRILTLLREKKYESKIKTVDKASQLNLFDTEDATFMILLPLLFKEDPLQLIKKEPIILPCIVPAANNENDWFSPTTTYYICMDYIRITEVPTFPEAVEKTNFSVNYTTARSFLVTVKSGTSVIKNSVTTSNLSVSEGSYYGEELQKENFTSQRRLNLYSKVAFANLISHLGVLKSKNALEASMKL